MPALGAEIARESPKTRKAFAAKLEQMIDMMADQILDVPRKTARKQAMATLATMMGTMVLSRIAGTGEFSDEILAAGREAVLGRAAAVQPVAKKPRAKVNRSFPRRSGESRNDAGGGHHRPAEQRPLALHGLVDVIGHRADPRQILAVGVHQQPEGARDRNLIRQHRTQLADAPPP